MEQDPTKRVFPILIKVLLGICILLAADRARLAIVLHGWKNDWSIGVISTLSLLPWVAAIGVFCFFIWQEK